MWSARSQRVLRARAGKFVLVTKEGKRYTCSPQQIIQEVSVSPSKKSFAFRMMKAVFLGAVYAGMIYSPVLLTTLAPLH
jgi:hypothetical protein